jgi:hypothetical protein
LEDRVEESKPPEVKERMEDLLRLDSRVTSLEKAMSFWMDVLAMLVLAGTVYAALYLYELYGDKIPGVKEI